MDTVAYSEKRRGRWKECAIFMTAVAVILGTVLIVVCIVKDRQIANIPHAKPCPQGNGDISLEQPDEPPVFADLTDIELKAVYQYLLNQDDLNVVRGPQSRVNSTYIYLIELLSPPKFDALRHLDNGKEQPERWAKVLLLRGDASTPDAGEYKVGPLPNPTTHSLIMSAYKMNPVPFEVRPVTTTEFAIVEQNILKEVDEKLENLLRESYGAKFHNCGNQCLSYMISPVSTHLYGKLTRNIWFWANHAVPYYTLHPLDLNILVNLDGSDVSKFHVVKVWYAQQVFQSLDELKQAYESGTIRTVKIPFPNETERMFSSLRRRGNPPPKDELHRPFQIEPDGKRYSVQGQHVQYLGWTFDYRMSSSTGPMLFDVRYGGERIAYEVSLQENSVTYAAYSPTNRFSDYVDSAFLVGIMSKSLVPGSDCPEHATFMPSRHFPEGSDDPITYQNSFCVFEQNTGVPLRRHHSYNTHEGTFYGGMMDDVLVLRSIHTVVNYDYIFDFVFHQNGALEVRAISTGYIIGNYYAKTEDKYGFQINDHLTGNIHHHLFNFKVDIDINGQSNRFETLDIERESVPNDLWGVAPEYEQIKFSRHLRKTEKEAAYNYNFDTPKYLIFHNDQKKTKHGVPRAYRLHTAGISKQLLSPDVGYEPSVSWARYQVAVTKYKDDESQSSSLYAIFDGMDPVVKFQKYIDDNENIVDQDLVAWVSLGVHHIPHTEDLPVTPTVGGHLQFFLLPYNYFPEEPSMSSHSNIFIEINKANTRGDNSSRVELEPGIDESLEVNCVSKKNSYREKVKENEKLMFVP